MKISRNVKTILDVLHDEVRGDVRAAFKKLSKDYSMTWMYQSKKKLFPTTTSDVSKELDEVYPIRGRQYEVRHIAEGRNVVMVELIESYPDPKTKKVYRTPLVLVLEMKGGKIRTGRHYCDPMVSFLHLSASDVQKGFRGVKKPHTIIR
jgi:ketosteroid isomerase-like protein